MSALITDQNLDDSATCSTDGFPETKKPLVPASPSSKRVSFGSHVDIQEVPHINDMEDDLIADTWYNDEDFAIIKQGMVVTVRLMMANKPVDESQTTRGLEFRTPAGSKQRKHNKLKALTAVWNEQVAQWKRNFADAEAISFVYQQQSYASQAVARQLALKDQVDARLYLGLEESEQLGASLTFESASSTLDSPERSSILPSAA